MAQERYNQTVIQYGSSSQQAVTATKQLQIAQENLVQVQKQNEIGTVGLISQVGLQLPAAIASSIVSWKMLGGTLGSLATKAAATVPYIASLALAGEQIGRGAGIINESTPVIGAYVQALHFLTYIVDPLGSKLLPALGQSLAGVSTSTKEVASTTETASEVYERFFSASKAPTGYAQYMDALAAANERAQRIYFEGMEAPPTVTIPVNADISQAQTQVSVFGSFIASIRAMLGIDADTSKAQSAAGALASYIAGMHPTIDVDLRYRPGMLNIPYDPNPKYPSEQYGTPYVPQTGPYILHKGEAVVPASQTCRVP